VTPRTLIACLLALALLAAGCGGDDSEQSAAPPAAEETPTPTATPEAEPEPAEISKNLDEKPAIPKPSGDPPSKLEIDDIVKGKGKAAKAGDNVTVQYVGVSFTTGEQFDASWDGGQPFSFPLGQGSVISGWDTGVAGMRIGGRRKLTIPPDQAYGTEGSPPAIQPNETLIFVVDLLEVA
jgi:peptidylprolyl isomerase